MTTATMPRTPEEFADAIYTASEGGADPHGLTRDRANLTAFARAYAEGHANRAGMEQQVQEQVDRRFGEIFRAQGLGDIPGLINRLNLAPGGTGPVARPATYSAEAPGAGIDGLFAGRRMWGDYLRAVSPNNKTPSAISTVGKIQEFQNAYSSDIPGDGGFLIATEAMRAELMMLALEGAIVRPRARVVPMSTLTAQYPIVDETTHSGSVFGGIQGTWLDEGQTMTDTSATFGTLELRARMLSLYTEIPNTLLADAPMLDAWVRNHYPEALRWFEDIAFIKGNGVGKPEGFLNALCAVEVAKEAGQLADTILWLNLVKAYSRMLPPSLMRMVWVANINTLPQLLTMSQSVGTGGSLVWIGEGGGENAPPVRILGRPVLFSEKMPTLGDAGDITAWDPGYYIIGDRQLMAVDTSTHFRFNTNKTAIKLVERVDGQNLLKSAVTPESGPDALSPVVKIAARA